METNLQISDHHPHDYLPEVLEKHPGAIESHRVPADPELWELERYLEFLELRRELLAAATNQLLDRLWNGVSELEPEADGEEPIAVSIELGTAEPAPVVPEVDEEQALIAELQAWLEEQGFDAGELEHELVGSAGEPEAILDIAWPQGLQLELTERVALLLGEPESVSQAATSRGFRVFTEIEQFKGYAASLIDREATDEDAYGAALAASG